MTEVGQHRRRIRPGTNRGGLYARAVSVEDPDRVVVEHPITDFNAAVVAEAEKDQVLAWLADHPTDEVHVYIYDGDTGRVVQSMIIKGEQA